MLISSLEIYVTSGCSRDKNVNSIRCVSIQEVSASLSEMNSIVHEAQGVILSISLMVGG